MMREHRAVVWLDRDGTIVDDPGYLRDPADVKLLAGAARAVARLNAATVTVVLVTNQSGIGRGLLAETDFFAVQDEVARQLEAEGARLDDVRFCPHAPGDADCTCRKPRPGMIDTARAELSVGASVPQFVVGDKAADLDLGRAAGTSSILVRSGEGASTESALEADGTLSARADLVADDLGAAVDWILHQLTLADDAPSC